MKKPLKIILSTVLILAFGLVLLYLSVTKPVKLGFTEKITLNHVYEDIHVEITDPDDFARLISICKGRALYDHSIPSCGFGTPELIFEGNGKKVVIYPGGDSCGSMRLGEEDKYFYGISDEKRRLLWEIMAKYGVVMPCG